MTEPTRRFSPVRLVRRRWALARSLMQDVGASALEWALMAVAGGTLVGLIYVAVNTKVSEKITEILGF
ncbi:hypothetical protein OHA44_37560 [Streptomyces sp. NBC_00144]|uniref:hypothetical protein n=1 Tax=Streptomyces sp. NBC_00144 TaxID=2975665 RepID=UPI0032437203